MRETIRALVAEHRAAPDDDAAPIGLESLELVMLTERLEDEFGIQVKATEVVPKNFDSIGGLVAFVQLKTSVR
ncbi:MAG: acyl carrier protein [Archangium sp.]|nr:acyl carrier protein [Archangium sp.]